MSEIHDAAISGVSQWVDDYLNAQGKDPEAIVLHRSIKMVEEAGEASAALIGYFDANPRKGKCATVEDVIKEHLDVAMSALGLIEHLTENQGFSLEMLDRHIMTVAERAGVVS